MQPTCNIRNVSLTVERQTSLVQIQIKSRKIFLAGIYFYDTFRYNNSFYKYPTRRFTSPTKSPTRGGTTVTSVFSGYIEHFRNHGYKSPRCVACCKKGGLWSKKLPNKMSAVAFFFRIEYFFLWKPDGKRCLLFLALKKFYATD